MIGGAGCAAECWVREVVVEFAISLCGVSHNHQ